MFRSNKSINFYQNVYNCVYYTEHKFNEILNIKRISDDLSFLHINIRSLSRNFDSFSNFWGNIDHTFSFIALSETWLKCSEDAFEMPGYNFIHNHRHNKTGGGVGLYFSANLNYKVRKDLTYNDKDCAESLFIEILKARGKNIVVGIVYRPPSQNINEFNTNTQSLINKISREIKTCYIISDFNLNLLNCQNHNLTSEFMDIMYPNMFSPLITHPTRIYPIMRR